MSLLQVTQSAEERPSKNETPEEFANWAFNLMRDFPTAPMRLQLSEAQVSGLSNVECLTFLH